MTLIHTSCVNPRQDPLPRTRGRENNVAFDDAAAAVALLALGLAKTSEGP